MKKSKIKIRVIPVVAIIVAIARQNLLIAGLFAVALIIETFLRMRELKE